MKKILLVLFLVSLLPLSITAQTVTWTDSLAISSTAVDTVFAQRWTGCSLWSEGSDLIIKFGTNVSDTVSWSSKKWVHLEDGQVFNMWPTSYFRNTLWRLEYKCSTGQTGALFITGVKTKYQ